MPPLAHEQDGTSDGFEDFLPMGFVEGGTVGGHDQHAGA